MLKADSYYRKESSQMNTQSQPVDPSTPLDDFNPSRFLKVTDLTERWKVKSITVTISRVTDEPTVPNAKDLDPTTADTKNPRGKPRIVIQKAFYFLDKRGNEWKSAYLLSAKVDTQSLKTATKAETAGELIEKRVTIIVGEYNKQPVLRISPMPPMEPRQEPPDMKLHGHTHSDDAQYDNCPKCNPQPGPKQTGEVIEATCKKCGMLAQVNPETQRFYSHQDVAGETCTGWADAT